MAIYELSADSFRRIPETTFREQGLQERQDLQRLLRTQIDIIAPDTLVIAEEFGEWEDSNRRIDLLAIDKDGNLVVIELKRTEDGGAMELQALRYAAMVSTMTFQRAVDVYSKFLKDRGIAPPDEAEARLLEFLDRTSADENQFAQRVRIVLASAEFSKELTTSVLWLNKRGLQIECVRLKPYVDESRVLVDVQPILPLPEEKDYSIQLRQKEQLEQAARESARDTTKYNLTIGGETHADLAKRWVVYFVIRHLISSGHTPEEINSHIPQKTNRLFRSAEGQLNAAEFADRQRQLAEHGGRTFERTRFFCEDGELFHVNAKTYALTNQWGGLFKTTMEQLATNFPGVTIDFKPC
jgi:hypothetical protein